MSPQWFGRARRKRRQRTRSDPTDPIDTWKTSGGIDEVRQVRELVARSIGDQPPDTRDVAVLLADECVANAVHHGGGHFEVTVRRSHEVLRVEVMDRGAHQPVELADDPTSERGRGLAIVRKLSGRWGTTRLAKDRKVVWFELPLH